MRRRGPGSLEVMNDDQFHARVVIPARAHADESTSVFASVGNQAPGHVTLHVGIGLRGGGGQLAASQFTMVPRSHGIELSPPGERSQGGSTPPQLRDLDPTGEGAPSGQTATQLLERAEESQEELSPASEELAIAPQQGATRDGSQELPPCDPDVQPASAVYTPAQDNPLVD
eukprot:CAMPEP_0206061232 /NCGR_PEP_ID=MMETSP1466-20131121/53602_1 /ASSEMBLY_ACC=CAM_ASM_001126 /TAXON_ID=44452 /ORGANISM="Pavlova gyrans, Strain CCMP608" /LENGTH=171 /DNA_ID=CAMNT_0053436581 /DNA_START=259 /DNA_END=774 /DNA_ORIENTATION=+